MTMRLFHRNPFDDGKPTTFDLLSVLLTRAVVEPPCDTLLDEPTSPEVTFIQNPRNPSSRHLESPHVDAPKRQRSSLSAESSGMLSPLDGIARVDTFKSLSSPSPDHVRGEVFPSEVPEILPNNAAAGLQPPIASMRYGDAVDTSDEDNELAVISHSKQERRKAAIDATSFFGIELHPTTIHSGDQTSLGLEISEFQTDGLPECPPAREKKSAVAFDKAEPLSFSRKRRGQLPMLSSILPLETSKGDWTHRDPLGENSDIGHHSLSPPVSVDVTTTEAVVELPKRKSKSAATSTSKPMASQSTVENLQQARTDLIGLNPQVEVMRNRIDANVAKVEVADALLHCIDRNRTPQDDFRQEMALHLYSLKQQVVMMSNALAFHLTACPSSSVDAMDSNRHRNSSRRSMQQKPSHLNVHVVRDYDESPIPYSKRPPVASQTGDQGKSMRQSMSLGQSAQYSSDWTTGGSQVAHSAKGRRSFGSVQEDIVAMSGSWDGV